MAGRYRYEGVREVRRLFRRLPTAATDEMAGVLAHYGRSLLRAMQADVPVKTGRLRAGLSMTFLRRTLRLRVGYRGKVVNRRLFYARFIQFGRKAQTVTVNRRKVAGSVLVNRRRVAHAPYQLRVKARAPQPFVYSRRTGAIIGNLRANLKGYWDRVLAKASRGAYDG